MEKIKDTTFEMDKEELLMLRLLSQALNIEQDTSEELDQEKKKLNVLRQEKQNAEAFSQIDWEHFYQIAQGHRVLSFLYDELAEAREVPETMQKRVAAASRKAVLQSYRLLFLCKDLCSRLEQAGIAVALLKGVGTASYYPVPELRKSGDVDLLLLDVEKQKEACEVLKQAGCTIREEQPSLHHVVFENSDGIEIELHTMLAEPFDNEKINGYLEGQMNNCAHEVVQKEVMGVTLPILNTAYHAYELLLHMLQHFLRAGFGLKLLCDWVVFWNTPSSQEEKEKYIKLVRESGVKGFSDMITQVCVKYLGLELKNVQWMDFDQVYPTEDFMEEIFEAEEFGNHSAARMVGLRDNNLWGYVVEFHHQMHLNFPKAGKVFLFWPVLWVITLVRFLYNNRKIRKVSAREVFKSAGKRSRLIGRLNLWKNP